MSRVCPAAIVFTLALATQAAFAQGVAVTGRVTDEQGAVVIGATATLSSNSGATRTADAGADGMFVFENVPTGDYTLRVAAARFATWQQPVSVGPTATPLTVTLRVAGIVENVDVGGSLPVTRTADISKAGIPTQELPRAVSIVTRDLLDQRIIMEISDALRTVSGFSQVGNYATFRPSYVLRGFGLSRVFEDGFNVPTTGRTAELADTERIEVLKGPAGALYGNINPGGILNLVSKRPQANTPNTFQLALTADGLLRPQADLSASLTDTGDVRVRGIFAFEKGDSYRDGISRETYFVSPSLSWTINRQTTLDVLTRYHRARGTHDQGWPISRSIIGLPPNRLLNEPTDTASYDNSAARAWLTHSLNDRWKLRAGVNVSVTDYDNWFQTFRLPPNSDLAVASRSLNRLPINEQGSSKEVIGQVDLIGVVRTGPVRHRLAGGFELTRNLNHSTSFADARYPNSIDYLAPIFENPVPPVVATDYFDDASDGRAVYLQNQISLTSRFDLSVGGRFDSLDTRRVRDNTGARTSRRGDNFAPFIGAVLKTSSTSMLFANYSESFTTQIGTQLQGGAMPDPNVGYQYEAGFKAETSNQRLSTSVTGFRITQENVLVAVPGQTYSIQSGVQRSEGVEVEVNGRVRRGLDVSVSYTALNAFVKTDTTLPAGATLINAADHTASLWSRYQFDTPVLRGLNAGLGVFFLGRRPANLIAPTPSNPGGNTVILPGYIRVDAAVGVDRGKWNTNLYLENLTNENYLTARGPVLHPNPPFTARLAFGYRF